MQSIDFITCNCKVSYMKRRLAASLALTTTAVLTTLTLGTAAQAGAPGYVKYGSYNWGEQCNNIGATGQYNHTWQWYYCETISPSSPTGPGLYNLWVMY
jgi:hypothetical protein